MVKLGEWEKAWIRLFASFAATLYGVLFWMAAYQSPVSKSFNLPLGDLARILISPALVAIGLCFTTYSLLQIWSIMNETIEDTATLY